MQNREKEIVNKAVRLLEEATGFKTTLHFYEKANEPDAVLKIANDDYQVEFNVEIKIFLNKARLGMIINQLRNIRGVPLLITEYVNPSLMDTMENNGINFIDAAGNALIKEPHLFIKLKGNKLNDVNKIRAGKRTYSEATLKVIFAFLCNPGLERKPIREIAKYATTAVGTVHKTLNLLTDVNKKVIVNKEHMLNEWVALFPEKLKPNYLIDRYEITENQINNLQLENYNALWGGEEAAARLTNYINPFIYTIYIANRQGEFILKNRLRKDPKGKLILMKKFWNFENNKYPGMTHPILTYADLLATGDPRNIEAAKIIYEKDIVRYIQED